MNKSWNVFLCDATISSCPVSEFILSCSREHQAKILRFINLLEEMGPNLPRPYADILHDGIHELRIKLSGEQIRLFYFFCFEKYIVFFETLRKHTDKIPEKYIIETYNYRQKILKELNEAEFSRINEGNSIHKVKGKLQEPEFRETYEERCHICKKTVEIIHNIYSNNHSKNLLSEKAGISLNEMEAFEDADHCSYELVEKLCGELGIDAPADCPKKIKKMENTHILKMKEYMEIFG